MSREKGPVFAKLFICVAAELALNVSKFNYKEQIAAILNYRE